MKKLLSINLIALILMGGFVISYTLMQKNNYEVAGAANSSVTITTKENYTKNDFQKFMTILSDKKKITRSFFQGNSMTLYSNKDRLQLIDKNVFFLKENSFKILPLSEVSNIGVSGSYKYEGDSNQLCKDLIASNYFDCSYEVGVYETFYLQMLLPLVPLILGILSTLLLISIRNTKKFSMLLVEGVSIIQIIRREFLEYLFVVLTIPFSFLILWFVINKSLIFYTLLYLSLIIFIILMLYTVQLYITILFMKRSNVNSILKNKKFIRPMYIKIPKIIISIAFIITLSIIATNIGELTKKLNDSSIYLKYQYYYSLNTSYTGQSNWTREQEQKSDKNLYDFYEEFHKKTNSLLIDTSYIDDDMFCEYEPIICKTIEVDSNYLKLSGFQVKDTDKKHLVVYIPSIYNKAEQKEILDSVNDHYAPYIFISEVYLPREFITLNKKQAVVENPIILQVESINDPDYIGPLISRNSLFFETKNPEPLKVVEPIAKKNNVDHILSTVNNPYSEVMTKINLLRKEIIITTVTFIFLLISYILLTKTTFIILFKLNGKEYVLKHLEGFSLFRIFCITMWDVYVTTLLLVVTSLLIHPLGTTFIILYISFEVLITYLNVNGLFKKNTNNFIKGDL